MTRQAIVEIDDGSGESFRFENADDVFVDVTVGLAEGKKASNASVILADPLFLLFDALPLPTKKSRTTMTVWIAPEGVAIPTKVFAGYVQGIEPTNSLGGNQVTIEATDKAKGARRKKRARIRRFTSLDQLSIQVAHDAGLDGVDSTRANIADIEFSRAVQHGETDWALLVRLMAAAGHKVKVRGDTLYIEEVGAVRPDGQITTLTYGLNVQAGFSFDVQERTSRTTPNVFDFDGEEVFASDDDEAEDRPVRIERAGLALANADFPSFTKGVLLKAKKAQARAKKVFTGRVTAAGLFVDVDTDDQVVLERFGARLSGVWNIEGIQLSFASNTTSFTIFNGGAS